VFRQGSEGNIQHPPLFMKGHTSTVPLIGVVWRHLTTKSVLESSDGEKAPRGIMYCV